MHTEQLSIIHGVYGGVMDVNRGVWRKEEVQEKLQRKNEEDVTKMKRDLGSWVKYKAVSAVRH